MAECYYCAGMLRDRCAPIEDPLDPAVRLSWQSKLIDAIRAEVGVLRAKLAAVDALATSRGNALEAEWARLQGYREHIDKLCARAEKAENERDEAQRNYAAMLTGNTVPRSECDDLRSQRDAQTTRAANLADALGAIDRTILTISKALEEDDTAQVGEAIAWLGSRISAALAEYEKGGGS